MAINAVTAYPCYKIGAAELIEKGFLAKPKIQFIRNFVEKKDIEEMDSMVETDGLINESESYPEAYRVYILENKKRNKAIIDIVNKRKGKKILILVKLIKHGEFLSEKLNAPYLNGASKKEERKKLLEDFTNNNLNVLIGTISIFSEGIDIPKLEIIMNVSGNKSDIKSIQVLGRVLRNHTKKTACEYIDFIDVGSEFFRKASLSRINAFRKEGHEVKYINIKTFK